MSAQEIKGTKLQSDPAQPCTRFHGRTIKYNQISQLATRSDFIDPYRFAKVNDLIGKTQDILFMPNAIKETHMQDAKYETSRYKIIIWGILQDGRRATVVLNGIQPYFEVRVPPLPDDDEPGDFAEDLFKKLKKQTKMEPTKYEIVTGRQFKYYKEEKNTYVRLYFDKSTFRTAAIKHVRTLGMETVHDDLTCYYRVICRDRLMSLTSWNTLSNYKIGTDKSIKGTIFHVDVPSGGFTEYTEDISNNSELLKDNSMTMTWDIETYSPDGQLPIPENPDHRLFMIATTFHWHHSSDSLLRVCIVDQPCKPHKDFLTIVCDSEERVIKAFGKIFEKMKPEFLIGFNDSDYDWPWLVKRAAKTPGLLTELAKCMDATVPWKPYNDEEIMKYNFTSDKVKVEAEAYAEGSSLQFPGYINLDVRTLFRQLYPTAEKSSLAWYLQKEKLGGKKEMPYQEMFKIYRRMIRLTKTQQEQDEATAMSDIEDADEFAIKTRACKTIEDFSNRMSEVAEYCVIDAQRCHELLKIRTVIMERREVSKVAYTSVYEAFYRANGSKVRNLVIARGQKMGLKISNITDDTHHPEGKYPGAYVFAPRKGLVTSKLTMRERREKARIYQTKNTELSEELKEWLKITDAEIEMYEQFIAEKKFIYIDFSKASPEEKMLNEVIKSHIPKCVKKFFEEITGRPITGLDFSSLYPSLIMTYNLSPEYMIINKKHARELDARGVKLHKIKFAMGGIMYHAWSVAHDNKIDPSAPDYKFGIYPQILKELFDTRKIMQKDLKKWESMKEHMEAMPSTEFNTPENRTKYEIIEFNFNCINSKQKALKVFMNTFYGETGNKNSPFFLLELAGGITSLGQKNIKAGHRFVVEAGCGTWYGDSVTGDTPLLVMLPDGSVDIQTIETLSDEQEWKSYENFKPDEPDRKEKEQRDSDLKIWTDSGWATINRVIRHKTNKKMFRVATHTGCVDVTEDHSLLTASGEKIKPTEVEIGMELLHSFPTEFSTVRGNSTNQIKWEVNEDQKKTCSKCSISKPLYEYYVGKKGQLAGKLASCKECCWKANAKNRSKSTKVTYFSDEEYFRNAGKSISKEEAFVWGLFFADGSCGDYKCGSWAISFVHNETNIKYLNTTIEYLSVCEPNFKFKMLDTLERELVPVGAVKLLVRKYRKLFYDKDQYKKVPYPILNASIEIKRAFFDGYYIGDGCKPFQKNSSETQKTGNSDFSIKGKIGAHGLFYLLKSIGKKYVSIVQLNDKPDIYRIKAMKSPFRKNPIAIKNIIKLPDVDDNTFVYDIETSSGHFGAGVGAMVLKNTDSLYVSMPEPHFTDIDAKYYSGKITKMEYWTELVQITFKAINIIRDGINAWFKSDNGTEFLRMAYEEALFPVTFLAKKKYYGIPHLSVPNFNYKHLFIKGLEVVKRGVSQFLRDTCNDLMNVSVSPDNLSTLLELVHNKIRAIYAKEQGSYSFDDFVMTDVYKPTKQNVKVQTFARRMQERGIKVKPWERFNYVIVKKNPFFYDHRGRKSHIGVGDKMEYAAVAKEQKMEIDLDYYMEGSINGQLARLIVYHTMFIVEPLDETQDEIDIAEKKIYGNASKYIENFCKTYYTNYQSKGKIYQKVFKIANKVVNTKLKEIYDDKDIVDLIGGNCDLDKIEDWLCEKAEKIAIKESKGYGQLYIEDQMRKITDEHEAAQPNTPEYEPDDAAPTPQVKKAKRLRMKELQEVYFSNKENLAKVRELQFKQRLEILKRNIRENLDGIKQLFGINQSLIENLSEKIKSILQIDDKYNDSNDPVPVWDDIPEIKSISENALGVALNENITSLASNAPFWKSIAKLKFIYINLTSNYAFIHKTRSIVDQLKTYRDRTTNTNLGRGFDKKSFVKSSVNHAISDIGSVDF